MFKIIEIAIITLLLTSCAGVTQRFTEHSVSLHKSITFTQSMMKINLSPILSREVLQDYTGQHYSLFLNNKFLMKADRNRMFQLNNKKLRWKLYEEYKKNGRLCFDIHYEDSIYKFVIECFRNTELETKFAIDLEIVEMENVISKKENDLLKMAVVRNTLFNRKKHICEAPYIKPISNLCGKPQDELDRLYLDCFRPLGAKACSYAAKQNINSSDLTRAEKRRRGIAATYLCKKGVGGDISAADIADEIGDELTDSDNALVSGIGYLFEGMAVLQNTATVTTCLDRFDMHCDIKGNNRKLSYYQKCKSELIPFNQEKMNIKNFERKKVALQRKRSEIINNTKPLEKTVFKIHYPNNN